MNDLELIEKLVIGNPEIITKETTNYIGLVLKTSMKNDQKAKDIPPFFHDIYDNNKLEMVKSRKDDSTYCLFKMYPNTPDFDYIMAVENKDNLTNNDYDNISISGGKFVKITFIKRGHAEVGAIVRYIIEKWIPENKCKLGNKPIIIQYDERFKAEYQKYGYEGDKYLGNPIADLYVGIE